MRDGVGCLRPRRGALLAPPRPLPVPHVSARQPAAGGLRRARCAPGPPALGRAHEPLHLAVRAHGHRRAEGVRRRRGLPDPTGQLGRGLGDRRTDGRPRSAAARGGGASASGGRREGGRAGPGLRHRRLGHRRRPCAPRHRRAQGGQPRRLFRDAQHRAAQGDRSRGHGHVGALRQLGAGPPRRRQQEDRVRPRAATTS